MKRQAWVVDASAPDKTLVELDSVNQCQRCSRGEGCGAIMLNSEHSGVQLWVTGSGDTNVMSGQPVLVEIDEQGSGWLLPVFAAYGLPLLGLLCSTMLATALSGNLFRTPAAQGVEPATAELFIVLSALAGLCGGIFAWRQLASGILARAERSLCLRSARIVGMHPSSAREPR
ncbi:MAG: SoxR reducing system RseC family protein [Granulosicoccus sp.]